MKNLLLGVLSLFLFVGTISAQDGKKSFKAARKALNTFNLDQMNNLDALQVAVDAIEDAAKDGEYGQNPDTWVMRGNIYNAIATQIITIQQTGLGDVNALPQVENPAFTAFESYQKSIELGEVKEGAKAIEGVQGTLNSYGVEAFDAGNYAEAYKNFYANLIAHDIIVENGGTSTLADEENFDYQKYLTGLSALSADMMEEATEQFTYLYEKSYENPAIYEALYKIEAENDIDAAYAYLEKGREAYPDDISILFAEINHFLKLEQLDVLIDKLKAAIEKEPENISVYNTLGNVYDQLYQKAYNEGNMEKAQEHFDNALSYYKQSTEVKDGNFDAIYSIGALYYNKAALIAQELNELASDLSKDGLKKYDAKREELMAEFDKALPYFQQAEKINWNDGNTVIALKEIYAKKDDIDMSNLFKERYDKLQAGEKLDASYFANN